MLKSTIRDAIALRKIVNEGLSSGKTWGKLRSEDSFLSFKYSNAADLKKAYEEANWILTTDNLGNILKDLYSEQQEAHKKLKRQLDESERIMHTVFKLDNDIDFVCRVLNSDETK